MATSRTSKPKPRAKTTKAAAAPEAVADAAPKAPVRKPRAKAATPAAAVKAATETATKTAVKAAADLEEAVAKAAPGAEASVESIAEAVEETTATAEAEAVKTAVAMEQELQAVEKTVEEAAKASQKAVSGAVKAGAETLTKNVEQAFATSKERYETVMQSFSDISAAGRENMDAFVSAGTVWAKGIEAVNAEIATISKRNLDDSIAAMKALAAAKTAKEYFELQSDLAKTSWDHIVADSTKIGEMLGEYSKDAMAPIQSRLSAAMEKLSKPLTL